MKAKFQFSALPHQPAYDYANGECVIEAIDGGNLGLNNKKEISEGWDG